MRMRCAIWCVSNPSMIVFENRYSPSPEDLRDRFRITLYPHGAQYNPRRSEGRKSHRLPAFSFLEYEYSESLHQSNILVSDDGRPLLADFGLSVSTSSTSLAATTYHGQKGSLRWMAKELHSNSTDDGLENPKHTRMTDIWALGMVILVSLIVCTQIYILTRPL